MTEDRFVAAIAAFTEGIGDDAALWQPSRSHRSVISTDMQVEGVHFTAEMMPLQDVGWRAMAAALSDLAAMGSRPVLATVALGFPRNTHAENLLEIYRGLHECGRRFKVKIVGGDLSQAPAITIGVTVVGEVRPSDAKTRAGGRAGDVLAVTGPLGAARAGLELARRAITLEGPSNAEASGAFRRPEPRIDAGRFFAASPNVTAMMDCSDGLSVDVRRLASASACGATLQLIPVNDAAREAAIQVGEDPQRFALAGGEDYELIVAIKPRAFPHLSARYAKRFKRPLCRVGVLVSGTGVMWNGAPLERSGWDHFEG